MRLLCIYIQAPDTSDPNFLSFCLSFVLTASPVAPVRFSNNQEREKVRLNRSVLTTQHRTIIKPWLNKWKSLSLLAYPSFPLTSPKHSRMSSLSLPLTLWMYYNIRCFWFFYFYILLLCYRLNHICITRSFSNVSGYFTSVIRLKIPFSQLPLELLNWTWKIWVYRFFVLFIFVAPMSHVILETQ
jgi:hypothetical protein